MNDHQLELFRQGAPLWDILTEGQKMKTKTFKASLMLGLLYALTKFNEQMAEFAPFGYKETKKGKKVKVPVGYSLMDLTFRETNVYAEYKYWKLKPLERSK